MRVSFNGLRINLAQAYNGMMESSDNPVGDFITVKKENVIGLRNMICVLLSIYEEGNDDIRDLSHYKLRDPETGEWSE